MAAPKIAYHHGFRFDVSPSELWDTIEHVEAFHQWWPWFHEVTLDGQTLATGAVLHGLVTPPIPYRMRVDIELVRCDRPYAMDAEVDGDLRGQAHLRLADAAQETVVEVDWSLEMMQRTMRVADRVAHPLMQWGHDRVVEMTVAGFRRHLELDGI